MQIGATPLDRLMIRADAADRIEALETRLAGIEAEMNEVYESSEGEDDLTEDEFDKIEKLGAQASKTKKQIEALQALRPSAAASAGRRAPPADTHKGKVPATPKTDPEKLGFKSFGEFAAQVYNASQNDTAAINRFQNVATTYASEMNGPDGGYLVPPEFRTEIWQKIQDEDQLMNRCDELVIGSNNVTYPKDETTPWQQSGGVQAYWESEAAEITPSNILVETQTRRLNKLTALVNVTEELLSDGVGLDSYLRRKAPSKMGAKINTAIIRGDGVGKPKGILASDSLLTILKEGSQAAGSIVFENISKMYARMYAPLRSSAIWLINQDCEPQLDQLAFPTGAATAVPLYMPSGGLSASPFATLKGRPVVPMEACSTVGELGDIIFVSMSQYEIIRKGGDIRTDVSMHLYFDQDLMSYRFIFRLTGQPKWGSTMEREQAGGDPLSWAVVLEQRA